MSINRLLYGFLAAALVLSVSNADAQKKKKKKSSGQKKAQVQKLSKAGPELKYDLFRRGVEFKVAEKREAQIDGLKRLLELGPEESEVPDIKFRLAELYFEKSQFYFFRAQEAEDRAIAAQSKGDKPTQESAKAEQKKNLGESQRWANQAVALNAEIRDGYPNYKRMPEVLFALGQSYWNAGRLDDAIEVYTDLIKNFKDSPLVADAWLAFGEYYFDKADLNRALKAYELAAADKRARVYGFALYKQGWCYYNLADWKKAMSKFRAVIYYTKMADIHGGDVKITLAKEAQKDFVRTYAHAGNPQRARFVLADITSGDEEDDTCKTKLCLTLLEGLGDIWFNNGNFEESAIVYRDLMKLHPKSSRTPLLQGKIVDVAGRSGDKKRTIFEVRRLVDEYLRVQEQVQTGTGDDAAKRNLAEAETLAESTVRRLAQLWNKEAMKTRQKNTYKDARDMYEDYLRLFPKSKFSYELTFQLGDLYYKLEEFDKAAKSYKTTVLADPKGKFLVEAANDNILAVEEHLKDLGLRKIQIPKGKELEAVEIHPERMRLIEACDRYVQFVPNEKADKLIGIKFKSAKLYYDHNHFDEAIKRFNEIVLASPEADEASFAANLIVDVYNLRENWQKLYDTSVEFLKNSKLIEERPKLNSDLSKFAEYAKFKLVQILEERLKKEGRSLRPVAKAYEEFQAEFPQSENADKALYNAAVAWDLVGEKGHGDRLRGMLMKEYKDSPLLIDVFYYTAKTHEEKAEYDEAAKMFEDFAEKYPTDERAQDAMYNASVFYAGIGKVKTATKLREEYLKKYGTAKGKEKEAADIYFTIAQDNERNGKWSTAAQRYEEFAKKFPKDDKVFEALWREATIRREKLRQNSKADKIEGVILGTYQYRKKRNVDMPPQAADYASRIALKQVDSIWPSYRKVKIRRPDLRRAKRFKDDLATKAKAREKVVATYTRIVTDYQQAYSTIGALYNIARAWDEFVDELTSVGCPKGLTGEQCDFFKQGLEETIDPARQSALQAYRTCVTKSSELSVFTQDSARCVKKLAEISPDDFPQMSEKPVPFAAPETKLWIERQTLKLRPDGSASGMEDQKTASEPKDKGKEDKS